MPEKRKGEERRQVKTRQEDPKRGYQYLEDAQKRNHQREIKGLVTDTRGNQSMYFQRKRVFQEGASIGPNAAEVK